MPVIWKSTVYCSRYSKYVGGVLEIEGRTRKEALALLEQLAIEASGAARDHAQQALSGTVRHTLIKRGKGYQTAYAARDGFWRGWDTAAWQQRPPAMYATWKRQA